MVNDKLPLAVRAPEMMVKWRYEIQANGRYWQWRKGSGKSRKARYGGKFESLPDKRKVEYERNRERRANKKTGAQS